MYAIKQQIIQHAGLLRLPEISDEEKIVSLIQLISLATSFTEGEWNGIVTTSGIVENVSQLMIETTNPKIRTLCGAAIEVIQQRGCEAGEPTDWRSLLSPIVSLLFNSDEKISEIGKQSILKSVVQNVEIINGLLQLGIFDETSELLDLTFPTQQTAQQSQQQILPQQVLLNILEVVEKIIRLNEDSAKKTNKLKKSASRIKQLNPSRQVRGLIGSILSILDDDEQEDFKEGEITGNMKQQYEIKNIELEQKILDKLADIWFMLDQKWINRWKNFTQTDSLELPGPITNQNLLKPDGINPISGLTHKNYRGINKELWYFLVKIYGGGPEIQRKTVDIYGD
ncbi:MAG: hypothetical protein EZS28_031304 [Streblomastix strix]|uniref:DUSP domain-containing protein n=1 Tax=Streblomastix strix TaxID=222440 RepID=A0A5J4USP7_9EUKA|nr:MAG: hypothetical protein EZS28_031304 [Streblomastix strix]